MLDYNKKSRFKAKIIAYVLRGLLKALIWTCKLEIKGGENICSAARKGSTILMLWHNRLALIGPSALGVAPTETFCAFISNSKDGDIAAEYTTSHRNGSVVRVPHDAKSQALQTLISHLKTKRFIAIITPDGPRGPRYEVKKGVALAAKETGAPIVPLSWTCNRYWELNTWDRMRIPKPFSKIEAIFGLPIHLSAKGNLDEDLKVLKDKLEALT
jgi:lysophospholipid acyltransferase (LPLAT)-like uncharacterized protein